MPTERDDRLETQKTAWELATTLDNPRTKASVPDRDFVMTKVGRSNTASHTGPRKCRGPQRHVTQANHILKKDGDTL